MQLITTTLSAEDSHEIERLVGVLTRVETIPSSGWMLSGRPVEEWAEDALRESSAVEYLARKLANVEGIEDSAREFVDRVMALEDEAREFAKAGRKA